MRLVVVTHSGSSLQAIELENFGVPRIGESINLHGLPHLEGKVEATEKWAAFVVTSVEWEFDMAMNALVPVVRCEYEAGMSHRERRADLFAEEGWWPQ